MQSQGKSSETPERSAPEGSCHFFVARKKRFCRFKPSQGHQYCAEHAGLMGADLERKRVQCPYEPKHTCYADKLKHHMKKCPSRPRDMPTTVLTVPEEELKAIIGKVDRLYDEHVGVLEEEILTHDCLRGELDNPTYGTAALRHRKQQASLIGHMDKLGLLRDRMCYLEMGAGKGQLSHWLHEAVEKYKDTLFVLIDRSHVRNKMDNLHKEEEVMERIRIDIEHLRLDKVPTIQQHDKPVVAFGKHLCGSATDLSLRCVCETLNQEEERQGEEGTQRKRLKSASSRKLAGAVIALCCHHRCTWTPYVGKKFFRDSGLTARDFQILASMSSWATCAWKGWSAQRKHGGQMSDRSGTGDAGSQGGDDQVKENVANDDAKHGKADVERLDAELLERKADNLVSVSGEVTASGEGVSEQGETGHTDRPVEEEAGGVTEDDHRPERTAVSSSINRHFSQEEREAIGRKCKRLIDLGRLLYLQDYGLKSCMKMYIEEFYTPENVVLLASS